jgi:hypothetical protein
MGERRGKWMVVVQEFDLDIKPTKLVKGKGLCKLAAEAQDQVNEDPGWENEITLWCGEAAYISPRMRLLVEGFILSTTPRDLSRKASAPKKGEPSD